MNDQRQRRILSNERWCLQNKYRVSLPFCQESVRIAVRETGACPGLLSTTAKYPIDRVCLKNFSIPAGSRVSNQENLFLGTLPKSIVLAMVDNDVFTGSYDKNLFSFKHYDLEFLAIYVDGQQFSRQASTTRLRLRSSRTRILSAGDRYRETS